MAGGAVTVLPLIIGYGGTIPATFSTALPQCGVETARLSSLLLDLHYSAMEYSSDVLSAHYKAIKRLRIGPLPPPQTSPVPQPGPPTATRARVVRRPSRYAHFIPHVPVPPFHSSIPPQPILIQEGLAEAILLHVILKCAHVLIAQLRILLLLLLVLLLSKWCCDGNRHIKRPQNREKLAVHA